MPAEGVGGYKNGFRRIKFGLHDARFQTFYDGTLFFFYVQITISTDPFYPDVYFYRRLYPFPRYFISNCEGEIFST